MLVIQAIPRLKDAVVMEQMLDTIIPAILYPTIQLASSKLIVFPRSTAARQALVYRVIDIIHSLGIRIGFEMTKKHLTGVMQRFFLSFDRAHDPSGDQGQALDDDSIESTPSLEESGFFDVNGGGVDREPQIVGLVHLEKERTVFRPPPTPPPPAGVGDMTQPHKMEQAMEELRQVFSPAVAYVSYVSFSHLAGSVTLGKHLCNESLIVRLMNEYREQPDENTQLKNAVSRAPTIATVSPVPIPGSSSDREASGERMVIPLQSFTGHSSGVKGIAVLDNENSFMSCSRDKTVKLWSLRSQGDGSSSVSCQWTYAAHKKPVFAATYLSSSRLVASCDSSIHLWDPYLTGEHSLGPLPD
ncbi:unnamed protein product, partial [Cyprideis torosa]